jgi:hypothetical protein
MPHAVPLATLAAGLGLLGGAVAGIHDLGSQLHGAAAGNQLIQRPLGHHCPHPVLPPAAAN